MSITEHDIDSSFDIQKWFRLDDGELIYSCEIKHPSRTSQNAADMIGYFEEGALLYHFPIHEEVMEMLAKIAAKRILTPEERMLSGLSIFDE